MKNITLSFLLLSSALIANSASAEGLGELREKAIALTRAEKHEEALPLYKRLLELSPNSLVALQNVMWSSWETKRYPQVIEMASRIVRIQPHDLESLNLLGQSQEATGQRDLALKTYTKLSTMEPKRKDLKEAMIRIHIDLKQYSEAKKLIQDTLTRFPDSRRDLLPKLARVEFLTGHYSDAAATWAAVLETDPKSDDYRFSEAEALYYSGSQPQAINRLKKLMSDSPHFLKAQDFLVDDALASGDYETVRKILTGRLTQFRPQDEPRILQLVSVYQAMGRWQDSLEVLQRFRNINPDNGQALLLLGDALMMLKRPVEAMKYYQQVYDKNPSSLRALWGISEAHVAMKRPRRALESIRKARKIDPTNPSLILREAQYLFDAGERPASRSLLTDFVNTQDDTMLPILLYHGLTPMIRDTLLAYHVHMTRNAFEDQMKSLKNGGYESVTIEQVAAWYKKEGKLPAKPVLITFDDARLDSFVEGDPILAEQGLKATMFAHSANVDENLPGHANWDQLAQYAKNGRWDIQSHGDEAHERIVTDADGRTGIYLANKIWLADQKRLETDDEWTTRVTEDHQRVKNKMKQHLNKTPIAFSWPEGNFGQDSVPNFPQAAEWNLKHARKAFELIFQQDESGINVRSRDRALLTRVQPDQKWSGEKLVNHLNENDPKTLAMRQLIRQAVWNNDLSEADRWLAEIQKRGASQAILLLEEARIRLGSGDIRTAVRLARQSAALEDRPETRQFLKDLDGENRNAWSPSFRYQEDNQDRDSWLFEQTLGNANLGPVKTSLIHHYGRYFERNAPTATDHGGGLSFLLPLGRDHRFLLDSEYHAMTEGPANDTWSSVGRLRSVWHKGWETELWGGRDIYDSARAINANTIDQFAGLAATWRQKDAWKMIFTGRRGWISDGNLRVGASGEIGRRLWKSPFSLVGRTEYDDVKTPTTIYYTPQQLLLYQAGMDFEMAQTPRWILNVRYLPGIGKENPTKWETVHDVQAGLNYQLGKVIVNPAFYFRKTPIYRGNTYFLYLTVPL